MAPIDTVYGTLDLVKAKLTKQYSEKSKLKEEIEGDGTYTMFAPSDDAWETLDPVSDFTCCLYEGSKFQVFLLKSDHKKTK